MIIIKIERERQYQDLEHRSFFLLHHWPTKYTEILINLPWQNA